MTEGIRNVCLEDCKTLRNEESNINAQLTCQTDVISHLYFADGVTWKVT